MGGAKAGAQDSSGFEGAMSSLGSQLKGNLNFSIAMDELSDQASRAMGKAAQYGLYASAFSSVASMAMSGASMSYGRGGGGSKETPVKDGQTIVQNSVDGSFTVTG